jgi:hypothetical protein
LKKPSALADVLLEKNKTSELVWSPALPLLEIGGLTVKASSFTEELATFARATLYMCTPTCMTMMMNISTQRIIKIQTLTLAFSPELIVFIMNMKKKLLPSRRPSGTRAFSVFHSVYMGQMMMAFGHW